MTRGKITGSRETRKIRFETILISREEGKVGNVRRHSAVGRVGTLGMCKASRPTYSLVQCIIMRRLSSHGQTGCVSTISVSRRAHRSRDTRVVSTEDSDRHVGRSCADVKPKERNHCAFPKPGNGIIASYDSTTETLSAKGNSEKIACADIPRNPNSVTRGTSRKQKIKSRPPAVDQTIPINQAIYVTFSITLHALQLFSICLDHRNVCFPNSNGRNGNQQPPILPCHPFSPVPNVPTVIPSQSRPDSRLIRAPGYTTEYRAAFLEEKRRDSRGSGGFRRRWNRRKRVARESVGFPGVSRQSGEKPR